MSDWTEISLAVPGERVEELTERLGSVASGGIAIEEPYALLGPDEGVRLESWRPTVLKLYFPSDDTREERRRQLAEILTSLPFAPELHERPVREEDWAQSWKQFFQVEHVGRSLVICPTWRSYTAGPGEVILDLDPGMAFGTGQHPTTRLCLQALESIIAPHHTPRSDIQNKTSESGMDRESTLTMLSTADHLDPHTRNSEPGAWSVLDLGCGSGILALAAGKLGCGRVLALDIEQLAVDATRSNAVLNGVAGSIRAERGSLGDAWPLDRPPDGSMDLIVANISARTIVDLAAAISAALRPNGQLVGSGIIAERLDEVLVALAAAALTVTQILRDGDWRAVIANPKPA
ncbi:MAG: 50S ribosomal protein L11 methyltransferase [Dehalococcoidia bacterium]